LGEFLKEAVPPPSASDFVTFDKKKLQEQFLKADAAFLSSHDYTVECGFFFFFFGTVLKFLSFSLSFLTLGTATEQL
jgi:hypothetical protein